MIKKIKISNGMKFIKKNLNKVIITFLVLFSPVLVLAAGDTSSTIINPITSTDLSTLIQTILQGVIKIGMPIIVLAVIYSGFLFVSAQGNSEKLNKAKTSLLYTLIGAGILLGSWAIAQLITSTVTAL